MANIGANTGLVTFNAGNTGPLNPAAAGPAPAGTTVAQAGAIAVQNPGLIVDANTVAGGAGVIAAAGNVTMPGLTTTAAGGTQTGYAGTAILMSNKTLLYGNTPADAPVANLPQLSAGASQEAANARDAIGLANGAVQAGNTANAGQFYISALTKLNAMNPSDPNFATLSSSLTALQQSMTGAGMLQTKDANGNPITYSPPAGTAGATITPQGGGPPAIGGATTVGGAQTGVNGTGILISGRQLLWGNSPAGMPVANLPQLSAGASQEAANARDAIGLANGAVQSGNTANAGQFYVSALTKLNAMNPADPNFGTLSAALTALQQSMTGAGMLQTKDANGNPITYSPPTGTPGATITPQGGGAPVVGGATTVGGAQTGVDGTGILISGRQLQWGNTPAAMPVANLPQLAAGASQEAANARDAIGLANGAVQSGNTANAGQFYISALTRLNAMNPADPNFATLSAALTALQQSMVAQNMLQTKDANGNPITFSAPTGSPGATITPQGGGAPVVGGATTVGGAQTGVDGTGILISGRQLQWGNTPAAMPVANLPQLSAGASQEAANARDAIGLANGAVQAGNTANAGQFYISALTKLNGMNPSDPNFATLSASLTALQQSMVAQNMLQTKDANGNPITFSAPTGTAGATITPQGGGAPVVGGATTVGGAQTGVDGTGILISGRQIQWDASAANMPAANAVVLTGAVSQEATAARDALAYASGAVQSGNTANAGQFYISALTKLNNMNPADPNFAPLSSALTALQTQMTGAGMLQTKNVNGTAITFTPPTGTAGATITPV